MTYKMDDALRRLERIHVTSRYMQLWLAFMSEEEVRLHLSRIHEDVGNARQVAGAWHEFAEDNGIVLPDAPVTLRHVQLLPVAWPLALGRWVAERISKWLRR